MMDNMEMMARKSVLEDLQNEMARRRINPALGGPNPMQALDPASVVREGEMPAGAPPVTPESAQGAMGAPEDVQNRLRQLLGQ